MDIIERLNDRLKELMKEHGVKAAPLARRAQLNESAVRDILRGRSKNPGIVTLERIAGVLDLRPSDLYEIRDYLPIVGTIRSEDIVIRVSDPASAKESVESPLQRRFNRDWAAIRVETDSLRPLAQPGDFLIFDPHITGVPEDAVGKLCICTSANSSDQERARMVRLGDKPETYQLVPMNLSAAPDLNKRIKTASPIIFVQPAALANIKKEPTHAGTDTLHETQKPFS
ncbi:MAG: helix-turn-helix transcriptional regulator [Neomegalonema sp.]|nr:helix-turn-helix transcriptional regulator [Neomegalonema sp.]